MRFPGGPAHPSASQPEQSGRAVHDLTSFPFYGALFSAVKAYGISVNESDFSAVVSKAVVPILRPMRWPSRRGRQRSTSWLGIQPRLGWDGRQGKVTRLFHPPFWDGLIVCVTLTPTDDSYTSVSGMETVLRSFASVGSAAMLGRHRLQHDLSVWNHPL